MEPPRARIEPLAPHHDRRDFESGEETLDRYLRDQVGQDERREIVLCYVLVEPSTPSWVLGYYTLSACGMERDELPEEVARRLPRYELLPAVLLGRLAVDRRRQGEGFGAFLLYDALGQALAVRTKIGVWAVIVDALHESAASFYRRYGFEPLPHNPLRLYLPLRRIAQLIRR